MSAFIPLLRTRELGAIDGLATGAVSSGEITTLEHELGNNSVEHRALEPQVLGLSTLLAGAQNSKQPFSHITCQTEIRNR